MKRESKPYDLNDCMWGKQPEVTSEQMKRTNSISQNRRERRVSNAANHQAKDDKRRGSRPADIAARHIKVSRSG